MDSAIRLRIVVLPEPLPPYRMVIGELNYSTSSLMPLLLSGKSPKGYRLPLWHFIRPFIVPMGLSEE